MNIELFRFINSGMKSSFLDWLMPLLSDKDLVLPVLVIAGLFGLALGGRRIRVAVLAAALAIGLADTLSEAVLKPWIAQPRPYAAMDDVNVHRSGDWMVWQKAFSSFDDRVSYSFPSSHAANTAALTAVLALLVWRSLFVTIPLTFLIGVSRIYTGNHYPLDVLAGWMLGAVCGLCLYYTLYAISLRVIPPKSTAPAAAETKPEIAMPAGA